MLVALTEARLLNYFYDELNRMILDLTRTLVHSWIRRFTIIISASGWLGINSKFMWEEVKGHPENLENDQLLSRCGFVQLEYRHRRFFVTRG